MKRFPVKTLVVIACLFTQICMLANVAVAAPDNPGKAQPLQFQVLGKSCGDWSAAWWQWAFSIPAATNPMLDTTGAFCGEGQRGPVWFLAGFWGTGAAERNCTVPRGKSIFFPIVNSSWMNTFWDDPNNTEQDYRYYADYYLYKGPLEATLDGNPVVYNPATPITRCQSPVFTADIPENSVFGPDPYGFDGYPIVSDGYWVMLPPLEPGTHILHFKAGSAQDVTFHLTVGK